MKTSKANRKINKRVILIWLVILFVLSLIQIGLLFSIETPFITNWLSQTNPGTDGPELFPSFMILSILSWFIWLPIGNSLILIIFIRFRKFLDISSLEKLIIIGILLCLESILGLLFNLKIFLIIVIYLILVFGINFYIFKRDI